MSSPNTAAQCAGSTGAVEDEIRHLEERLARAKARLQARNSAHVATETQEQAQERALQPLYTVPSSRYDSRPSTGTYSQLTKASGPAYDATTHFHLLLADSALPLGSFAFSSGLESYLAHSKANPASASSTTGSFATFLALSISSYASTTLPFLLAAHRDPTQLPALDDALDAAVVCTVGKRASVAQGRALLGLWERSFAPHISPHHSASPPSSPSSSSSSSSSPSTTTAALQALASYALLLRRSNHPAPADDTTSLPPAAAAHLAPLFGAIAHILGLGLAQTAYVFLLGHAKALVSAAVRASVLGPYAAQRVLAARATRDMLGAAVAREWATQPEEAGQAVPVMDLWVGRHEVLYSRIFNS